MKPFFIFLLFFLSSCTSTSLRKQKEDILKAQKGKVWIYKMDGSKSCGFKKGIAANKMASLLTQKGVKIYKYKLSHDGKMRILVCGTDTGNIVELLIDGKHLPIAGKENFLLKEKK